jgi:hypothetical protein
MAHKWEVFGAALLLPMLVKLILSAVTRRRPGLLPSILWWAKVFNRALFFAIFLLVCGAILFVSTAALHVLALVYVLSVGVSDIKFWAERKIDPDGYARPTYGWWPPRPY